MFLSPALLVILSIVSSFAIVYGSVPTIVNVAHLKKLYDEPGRRKSHFQSIPNLGGISIFAGFIITAGVFTDINLTPEFLYLIIGLVVLFFVGLKDDILIIAPTKKLYGEIIASLILVVVGDLRFTSLHGFMGINEIGYLPGIILTIFVMIVVTNAFNLIDGIDGLASGLGIVISITFGLWFFLSGNTNYAVLAASLLGSLVCFFGFNVFGVKNKIFMGDTGSLLVGFVISVFVIKFNEINVLYDGNYSVKASPAVSFGILIIPLFDTLRVFLLRIARGRSPFSADKNHLHHRMLKLGLSHFGSTLLLLSLNIVFIVLVWSFQSLGIVKLMLLNLGLGITFIMITEFLIHRNKHHELGQNQARHHARA
jgi:UDP-GlcNAc:undecaprenyl-phosphate/decaprenyl-phosphate GlcNAc-1-phosphate transferase